MDGLGDCYVAAYKLFTEHRFILPTFLCHGIATGTGCGIEGVRYGHAWVEMHGDAGFVVLDFSNRNRWCVPGDVYYRAGTIKPEEVIRYTKEQAMMYAMMFEHFGYWDPMFHGLKYQEEEVENER